MPLAIFGIENSSLSLAATFAILSLIAIWIALVVFTFIDARRRISDPFLVGCSTAASLFPFVGTLVYTILRPAEFLDDVREREVEMKSAETELRHLEANSCHKCGFPAQPDFVRCPGCRGRLKEPCPSCERPVGLRWKVCPYCEHTLVASKRSSRSGKEAGREKSKKSGPGRKSSKGERPAAAPPVADSGDRAPSRGSSSDQPATKEEPRSSRRVTRRETSGSSSERSERSERTARPAQSGDSDRTSGPERRRITVSDDDTQVSHRPINSGDSQAPTRDRDRN